MTGASVQKGAGSAAHESLWEVVGGGLSMGLGLWEVEEGVRWFRKAPPPPQAV